MSASVSVNIMERHTQECENVGMFHFAHDCCLRAEVQHDIFGQPLFVEFLQIWRIC